MKMRRIRRTAMKRKGETESAESPPKGRHERRLSCAEQEGKPYIPKANARNETAVKSTLAGLG